MLISDQFFKSRTKRAIQVDLQLDLAVLVVHLPLVLTKWIRLLSLGTSRFSVSSPERFGPSRVAGMAGIGADASGCFIGS